MTGICEGRVAVVTGAGRGIGRGHALEFARQGAKVVVNDLGANVDGTGSSDGPAGEVVDEIRAMGAEAVANGDDVADWAGAAALIRSALDTWGRIDTLVTNAGILRDRMLVSMSEEDWDAVMRVHLKGTFCPVRHAANHWRELAKAGQPSQGRIITTSSGSGLYGNVGQTNYGAAKSGIATFSRVAAAELGRYGVTVNSIAPAARSRMTESLFADMMAVPDKGFDAMAAENVAPLVVWLGSDDSAGVTGQVFEVSGGRISVTQNWERGPQVDKGDRWEPSELGPVVRGLLDKAAPAAPVIGTEGNQIS
jgi:NAD(P)-dependent dehydrogenase (short-subunit alcohol dehydrogenase family)